MLRIEGLTAGYSAIPVLNGVSIKVEQGQFVAIVGPNGACPSGLRDARISASPTSRKDARFFPRSR